MFRKSLAAVSAILLLSAAVLPSVGTLADETLYDRPDDAQLYCDFNTAFPKIANDDSANIATGNGSHVIRLMAAEGAVTSTVDGALKVEMNGDSYIRFWSDLTPSVKSGDTIAPAYKYMVIRMKGTAENGGSVNGGFTDESTGAKSHSLAIGFGNIGNSQNYGMTFRQGGWGTNSQAKTPEGGVLPELTDAYQTLVIQMDASLFTNMLSSGADTAVGFSQNMMLRNIGPNKKTLYIDEIYFTDTVPQEKPSDEILYDKPADAQVYADFNTAFPSDVVDNDSHNVSSGNGSNTIRIMFSNVASFSNAAGALKIEYKSNAADTYIRFQSSMKLANSDLTSKYKYMVLRMKGESPDGTNIAGAPGAGALTVGFGSWASIDQHGFTFRSGGYNTLAEAKDPQGNALPAITSAYQTFIIKMEDGYFQNMGDANNSTMMAIRSIGAFNKTLTIDEIYFTDTIPQKHQEGTDPSYGDDNTIPADGIYIDDGRRDAYAHAYAEGSPIAYTNGDKASAINEINVGGSAADAFTMKDGVITYKSKEGNESSYAMGDNYYNSYAYTVFRIRSTDGSDGSKFTVKLGSNAATAVRFDKLKFSADNYVKAVTGEWQDIYVKNGELNGANGMQYLKIIGQSEGTYEIDCIYMTDTVPDGYTPGPAIGGTGPSYGDNNTIPADGIYIDDGRRDAYAWPFQAGNPIQYANGSKASAINEINVGGSAADAFTMKDGVIAYKSKEGHESSYGMGDNYYNSYAYTVFRIRSTDGSDGSKFALKLGSNAATAVRFDQLKFSADNYVKAITGEWQDIYVKNGELNGANGMQYLKIIGQSEGAYEIDCIYMTDTVPDGYTPGPAIGGGNQQPGDLDIPADGVYIDDGSRSEFASGSALHFDNGGKTSFLNEINVNKETTPDGTYSMKDGKIVFKATAGTESSHNFGENYYSDYRYMVFRIRSTDGSDGSRLGLMLGSYGGGAVKTAFNKLKFSADSYVKPITGEWQDIYVLADKINGADMTPYLKLFGLGDGTYEIDCIYMTNTVPDGYTAGPAVNGGTDSPDTGVALPAAAGALGLLSAAGAAVTRKRKHK